MPNPKHKHSKARTAKRKATKKITARSLSSCPQCGKPKLPHRICLACGYYNGVAVLAVEEKKKKEKKR